MTLLLVPLTTERFKKCNSNAELTKRFLAMEINPKISELFFNYVKNIVEKCAKKNFIINDEKNIKYEESSTSFNHVAKKCYKQFLKLIIKSNVVDENKNLLSFLKAAKKENLKLLKDYLEKEIISINVIDSNKTNFLGDVLIVEYNKLKQFLNIRESFKSIEFLKKSLLNEVEKEVKNEYYYVEIGSERYEYLVNSKLQHKIFEIKKKSLIFDKLFYIVSENFDNYISQTSQSADIQFIKKEINKNFELIKILMKNQPDIDEENFCNLKRHCLVLIQKAVSLIIKNDEVNKGLMFFHHVILILSIKEDFNYKKIIIENLLKNLKETQAKLLKKDHVDDCWISELNDFIMRTVDELNFTENKKNDTIFSKKEKEDLFNYLINQGRECLEKKNNLSLANNFFEVIRKILITIKDENLQNELNYNFFKELEIMINKKTFFKRLSRRFHNDLHDFYKNLVCYYLILLKVSILLPNKSKKFKIERANFYYEALIFLEKAKINNCNDMLYIELSVA